MLSLQEFIDKYNGKPVDVDGYPPRNPFQCKDLVNRYVMEVLGYPRLPVGNAVDMARVYPRDLYTFIPYKSGLFMLPGDIPIWGKTLGPSGHIAVKTNHPSEQHYCESFDQNWPLGSYCHHQIHEYSKSMLGWLRAKSSVIPLKDQVPTLFQQVWGRAGAPGELRYFVKRLEKGTISGKEDLLVKMQYWHGVVYPNGKYSLPGDARWQIEKFR